MLIGVPKEIYPGESRVALIPTGIDALLSAGFDVVIEEGAHLQRYIKVTTLEGEDWIYFSGAWNDRSSGDYPVTGIKTDADIIVCRIIKL